MTTTNECSKHVSHAMGYHRSLKSVHFAIAVMLAQWSSAFLLPQSLSRACRLLALEGNNNNMDELLNELLSSPSFNETLPRMSATEGSSDGSRKLWRTIDWKKQEKFVTPTSPSPVERVLIRDRLIYLKRDDQLRLPGSRISGNKARKMLALSSIPDDEFPSCIVSYGGPQSNAMLALAATVHFQNEKEEKIHKNGRRRFIYYTKNLPRFLRNQPSGNLFRALSLGMELRELHPEQYSDLFGGDFGGSPVPPQNLEPPVEGDSLWIPQGAASEIAVAGTRLLAQEIWEYWSSHGLGRPLAVVVPCGTCSTALFVHQALRSILKENEASSDIVVVAVPCVGDEGYARRQMQTLSSTILESADDIPFILGPSPDESYFGIQEKKGYFPFGKPHPSVLKVYQEMEDNGILLDLLYGAPAWTIILRHLSRRTSPSYFSPLVDREVMYVHSGGMEGINSQLLRYKYEGLIDAESIQLPGKSKRAPEG